LRSLDIFWDRISIVVHAEKATFSQWLLLNEAYDPQWRARVGPQEVPLARANGWAMGLRLPELARGTHQIDMEFTDIWFNFGKVLFGLWVGGFFLAEWRSWRNLRCRKEGAVTIVPAARRIF
jgi:uncharacterized membrane protein YfhO